VRRGPYAKVAARNAERLKRIRALKADHPFWGYRRIWAYLRYGDGLTVNQKRVYGVMKAADLLVKPNLKLRARRKPDTRILGRRSRKLAIAAEQSARILVRMDDEAG
jgi:putative transposase